MGTVSLKKVEDTFIVNFSDMSEEFKNKYELSKPDKISGFIAEKIFSTDGTVLRYFKNNKELTWEIKEKNGKLFSSRFKVLLPYFFKPKKIFDCLFSFQKDGIAFLEEKDACILADDMGLGKTVQTIAALINQFYNNRINQAWIFCPNSLLNNWEIELNSWAPQFQVKRFTKGFQGISNNNIILVPYSSMGKLLQVIDSKKLTIDVVVADESHKLRNSGSGIHNAFKKIKRDRTWFLTGTPLERDVKDIRNTLALLMPKKAGIMFDLDEILLKAKLEQVTLRRLKSDKLKDLPPAIKKTDWLSLCNSERIEYQKLLSEMRKAKSHEKVGFLVPLRKFLSGFENPDNVKQQRSIEIVKEAFEGGQKVLIFSNFNEVLQTQYRALLKENIPAFMFNGTIPLEDRQLNVKKFKELESGGVMLLNAKSGSEGLTFTEATIEIFLDEWWNPSNNEQAEDRAIRIGQKNTVTVYKLRVLDSLDQNLSEILDTKTALRQEFIEDLLIKDLVSG